MRLQFSGSKYAVWFSPEMYLGVATTDQYPSWLDLPISFRWRTNSRMEWQVNWSWTAPLSGFADTVRIPVGFGMRYAASSKVDIGTEFEFTNLFGRSATFDSRALYLRLALRF